MRDEQTLNANLPRNLEVVRCVADQQDLARRQTELRQTSAAEFGFAVRV